MTTHLVENRGEDTMILDNLTDGETASMMAVWLLRVSQNDDHTEDVCDAAARLVDGADKLLALLELEDQDDQ